MKSSKPQFKLRKIVPVNRFKRSLVDKMFSAHGKRLKSVSEFSRTCSSHSEMEAEEYYFKVCPFGELRLWKGSGRISVSAKFTVPNYNELRTH